MNLSKNVRYSSKYPEFKLCEVEKTQSGRVLVPNLSNYELLEEEKIYSSWQNIEFSNNLLEFFGKFA